MRLRFTRSLASLAVLLAACTDLPNEPTPTSRVSAATNAARTGAQGGTGKSSLDLIEDDYAAGAIDKQNVNRYREQALSAPDKLPAKYRSSARGKDATPSLVRMALDWKSLAASTQQEILDLRAKGLGDLSQSIETQHFVLHYTTTGSHAVPLQDADENNIPDFIDVAAQSNEAVWQREVVQLNYPPPVGMPAQKFHVYYKQLDKYYGATYPQNITTLATSPVPLATATGYIVIENDFYGFPPNDEDVTGKEVIRSGALKVTQAHEFMHAIQFAINVSASGWLMESHATWAEDAVYDAINDWHGYLDDFVETADRPLFSRDPYGGALFQHWVSETYGQDMPRKVWMAAKTNTLRDAIRVTAFGGTWEPLRSFAPVEYTLGISDFTTDAPSTIPLPTLLPIRETHTSYPVSVAVGPSTNKVASGAPWAFGGANYVEFVPAGNGTLTVTFDGADGFAWRAVAVAKPKNGGSPTIYPISLNTASAGSISINGFGTKWSKVTLVPVIVGETGTEVPYSYGATIN